MTTYPASSPEGFKGYLRGREDDHDQNHLGNTLHHLHLIYLKLLGGRANYPCTVWKIAIQHIPNNQKNWLFFKTEENGSKVIYFRSYNQSAKLQQSLQTPFTLLYMKPKLCQSGLADKFGIKFALYSWKASLSPTHTLLPPDDLLPNRLHSQNCSKVGGGVFFQ